MANILILGGGFGGLMTAERLVSSLGGDNKQHRITLVSPHDRFTFYPALVRLAFGSCRVAEISFDLVEKLKKLNVRFVQGEAIRINTNRQHVQVAGKDFNGEISYDFLVIALGRRLATEKIGGFYEHAHHLLGVKAAIRFGESIAAFKKGRIVVGLAPEAYLPVPVCETAFALAKKFELQIKSGEVSVSVVFPETIQAAFGGADLHEKLEQAFEARRIKVISGYQVHEVTSESILSADGQAIDYDLLMLVPPFRGQAILGGERFLNESYFVETDNFMRVLDTDKTYAAGDITAFPGPKLAFMAVRQAQIAAENIVAELRGATPPKIYHHDLAVIIDEAETDAIFLHYGIWDETMHGLKVGKMWSRMKNEHNQLWDVVRQG